MTKRPRTERRERERALQKLARDREKLARLEPGGAPERPIAVESASQIEVHARALGCARCGQEARVDEHAARTVGGRALRVVRLVCPACGAHRDVWFTLAGARPS